MWDPVVLGSKSGGGQGAVGQGVIGGLRGGGVVGVKRW